jgi:hypothetical protein
MFLNQQKKTQILESSDLQTLLKAISNNSEVLTESEISTVSSIEDYIKEDTKLVLSQDAKLEYYRHLDKLLFLDDCLEEGLIRGIGSDIKSSVEGVGTEVKGWFENVDDKIKHLNANCDDLIKWLSEDANKRIKLDGNSKAIDFFKTSKMFQWRFYFILSTKSYNQIMSDIKSGDASSIQKLMDIKIADRKESVSELERITDSSDFISLVKIYKQRCNDIAKALKASKTPIKGFPFQVMLLGLVDLSSTIKRIVSLSK